MITKAKSISFDIHFSYPNDRLRCEGLTIEGKNLLRSIHGQRISQRSIYRRALELGMHVSFEDAETRGLLTS
jgi:hypothetical protein